PSGPASSLPPKIQAFTPLHRSGVKAPLIKTGVDAALKRRTTRASRIHQLGNRSRNRRRIAKGEDRILCADSKANGLSSPEAPAVSAPPRQHAFWRKARWLRFST